MPESPLHRFLSELRRRRVFRVAAVYVVAAWLVLQVGDVVVEPLRLPTWTLTLLIVLAGLGFPVVLALAWVFQITPEGIERTPPPSGRPPARGRAAGYVGLGILIALTGFGAYAYVGRPGPVGPPTEASPSVAVLPFANLSGDPDNEYFSDGITDDVIVQLATIGDLAVIGRTSVMRYKGTTLATPEIARELGVGHVLAGSVRREGEQVRVVVQLLDGRTERPVWAETYDRDMTDIFAIQSELAQAIAGALRATLTEDQRQRLEKRPTESLEAYDAYLRAAALDETYREQNEAAIELLRHAIRLDPGFAGAHAALARRYAHRIQAHGFPGEWADSAVATARRAVALDSTLPAGHAALGFGLAMQGRLRSALDASRRAVALNPSDGEAATGIVVREATLGRYDEAIRWGLRGIRQNPKSPWLFNAVGFTGMDLGDFDAAERYLRRALEVQPDFAWAYTNIADLEFERGRPAEARRWIERLLARDPDHLGGLWAAGNLEAGLGNWTAARRRYERAYRLAPQLRGSVNALSMRAYVAHALLRTGERRRGEAMLDTALARAREEIERGSEYPGLRVELAGIHALRGDLDGAMGWMEAAYDAGWRYCRTERVLLLEPLRTDARFAALLDRIREDCAAMRRRVAED